MRAITIFKTFFTILIFLQKISYSQITIGNIEKIEEPIYSKPESYDSLKNWPTGYKQYIGLQIYLPLNQRDTNRRFLYSLKPNKILAKSPMYKRFESHGHMNTKIIYDSTYTLLYKPIQYEGRRLFNETYNRYPGLHSDYNEVCDNYYTILKVFHTQNDKDSIYNSLFSQLYSIVKRENIDYTHDAYPGSGDTTLTLNYAFSEELLYSTIDYKEIIYLLRNEKNNDSLYMFGSPYSHSFILVPYFVKQQQMFKGKYFINIERQGFTLPDLYRVYNSEDENGIVHKKAKTIEMLEGRKWFCKDVTLLKQADSDFDLFNNRYQIHYIMANDSNQTFAVNKDKLDRYFITEKQYLNDIAEKKLKQFELQAKLEKERRLEEEKHQLEQNQRKIKCIEKFGSDLGALISNRKVKLGMTKEMCEYSWGSPFWKTRTTISSGIYENWYYGLGFSLHFENGILKRIEE